MKDNLRSKPLMDGAILTAIVFILMVASNIPGLYILGSIVVPIPVTILYIKYKWKISILSVIVGTILTSLFLGPVMGITTGISTFAIGIPLGIGIDKKKGNLSLILVSAGCFVSFVATLIMTIYLTMGMTLNSFIQTTIQQYQQSMNEVLKLSGNEQTKAHFEKIFSYMTVNNLKMILPIALIIMSLIMGICIFIITRKVLVRLRIDVPGLKPFTRWYINPIVIAIFIIVSVLGMELKRNSIPAGEYVFVWGIGVLALLCIIQALSVISYLLVEKLKISRGAIVVIVIVLVFSGIILYIAPIGLIDIILDYRSLEANSLGSIIRKKLDPKQK